MIRFVLVPVLIVVTGWVIWNMFMLWRGKSDIRRSSMVAAIILIMSLVTPFLLGLVAGILETQGQLIVNIPYLTGWRPVGTPVIRSIFFVAAIGIVFTGMVLMLSYLCAWTEQAATLVKPGSVRSLMRLFSRMHSPEELSLGVVHATAAPEQMISEEAVPDTDRDAIRQEAEAIRFIAIQNEVTEAAEEAPVQAVSQPPDIAVYAETVQVEAEAWPGAEPLPETEPETDDEETGPDEAEDSTPIVPDEPGTGVHEEESEDEQLIFTDTFNTNDDETLRISADETAEETEITEVTDRVQTPGDHQGSDDAAMGYLSEAFGMKASGDTEGAILNLMCALDQQPSDDLVFWIVLDICSLYKDNGQADFAAEMLKNYADVYGHVMNDSVRAEIEKQLCNSEL